MIRTVAAALVFFGAIGWWGGARLISAEGSGAASVVSPAAVSTPAPPAAASATAEPASPASSSTAAATSEQATTATVAPTAATSAPPANPTVPKTVTSGATQAPAAPAAAPTLTDGQQIALQQQLEALGKTYLKALQANDVSAISAMLAGRCAGADVAALVARRRAEVAGDAGTGIEQITPLNQFVGHFDPSAGEAHTVLQWSFNGQRGETTGADGWLLEGGVWKSAVCG